MGYAPLYSLIRAVAGPELEDELKRRDERIAELRDEVDEGWK